MTETRTLPTELPLFPLGGVILLPGEVLPLNVFEPRYLNMVDDARRGHGHIGIVQTLRGGTSERPELARIGCAGHVSHFEETDDGRYLITLDGVSRFMIKRELDVAVPYRVARADYREFRHDLEPPREPVIERERFIRLLQTWFAQEGMRLNWDTAGEIPLHRVVDQLSMNAPFSGAERHRLLMSLDAATRLIDMEEIVAARLAGKAGGAPH